MPERIAPIATVVAAVVVFATAGYVITHNTPVAGSGESPGYSAPVDTPAAVTTAPPDVATGPVIAFLGDDWTAASGVAPATGFVSVVGASLHVPVQAFAVRGGGYAKPGEGGKTYADLVAAVTAARPQIVVVSGGRNDVVDYVPTMKQATTDVFAALHRALPHALIVGVAPWWGDSAHPAKLAPVTAAVKSAVTAVGGTYLDGPDPLAGHSTWMADDADPNASGYAAIAAALTPKLQRLVAGR